MSGVGQARLGSDGSVTGNASLLAWLSEEKRFLTTNTYNMYRIRSSSNEDFNIAPEIVPIYAVTTEGFGNWGHGYGLNIEKSKLQYSANNLNGFSTQARAEQEKISLNYGIGKKITSNFAIGSSVYVARFYNESFASYSGVVGGDEFFGSVESFNKEWTAGSSIGMSYKLEEWSFGLSSKFNLIKFDQTNTSKQVDYNEVTDERTEKKTNEKEPSESVPVFAIGIEKRLESARLAFDIGYVPSYVVSDVKVERFFHYGLGLELSMLESWKYYTGMTFFPASQDEDGDQGKDAGSVSMGFSRRGKNSRGFGGISWNREILVAQNEVISLIFGTSFSY